jgi:SsrA-binding protein
MTALIQNKKARHDYAILETFEAGIALQGTEVKSLREGRANLRDAYALIEGGEVLLRGLQISPTHIRPTGPSTPCATASCS